jgi:hypothetical protein
MEIALVFPLLSGKRPVLERFVEALQNEFHEEHSRTHATIQEESWYVQSVSGADVLIVVLRGEEPEMVFAELAVSLEPFAVWFRERTLEITGVNISLVPPFQLPECIFHAQRPEMPERAVVHRLTAMSSEKERTPLCVEEGK